SAVARDVAVHALRLTDATVVRAVRRNEVLVDRVIAVVVEAIATVAARRAGRRVGAARLDLADTRRERVARRARTLGRARTRAGAADVLRDRGRDVVRRAGVRRAGARTLVVCIARGADLGALDVDAVADAVAVVIDAVADLGASDRGARRVVVRAADA